MPPDFESLSKTLLCQSEPARVPLGELYVDPVHKEAVLGYPAKDLESDLKFWAVAGYDYALYHYCTLFLFRPELPREFVYDVVAVSTSPIVGPVEEHGKNLNSWEDFERFPWPDPERVNLESLEKAGRLLPEGMRIITGTSGFYEQIWMLMGFENFGIALYEKPDLVAAIFKRIGEILLGIWRRLAASPGVGAMWLGDDVAYSAGLMVDPKVLRRHTFPWMEQMAEVCRERDLPFIYHSDGNIMEIIPDLLAIGINALHPIETKAMDIFDLKRRFGERLCLIGGLDMDRYLTRGSPEETVSEGLRFLRRLAPGGGYVLGSSNSIASFVRPECYASMRLARDRYAEERRF